MLLRQIVKEKQAFERVVVTREEALSMFEENKFKAEIINGLPQDATISLYRCGPMVSVCSDRTRVHLFELHQADQVSGYH